jgi:hypothetical protein
VTFQSQPPRDGMLAPAASNDKNSQYTILASFKG